MEGMGAGWEEGRARNSIIRKEDFGVPFFMDCAGWEETTWSTADGLQDCRLGTVAPLPRLATSSLVSCKCCIAQKGDQPR